MALAKGLGFNPVIKRVQLRFPWSFLPEFLWSFPLCAYSEKADQLKGPRPDVIISSGRAAAPGAAEIRRRAKTNSKKAPFIIHLMDPRMNLEKFDLVIAPTHDDLTGKNVISTLGTLHAVSDKKLSSFCPNLKFSFHSDKRKKIAVFLGGESRHYAFDEKTSERLVQDLDFLEQAGYGLMISPSRRTPSSVLNRLQETFSARHFIWDGAGDNPYLDMIYAADAFIVTADSVSMISEMAALKQNLYIYQLPEKKKTRLSRFNQGIVSQGYAEFFDSNAFSLKENQKQLNELDLILPLVQKKMQTHFSC